MSVEYFYTKLLEGGNLCLITLGALNTYHKFTQFELSCAFPATISQIFLSIAGFLPRVRGLIVSLFIHHTKRVGGGTT